MYYAFLTNPHFFTLEAFHQKGHAFYQFVTYLVREITSNAGSDGAVFVSLFTAALKQVPTAIRYYTHELASLAMMSESRDEVAVNRTPVEEYVRVVVLHFFDSLDEEHALPLQAVMVELLELNLKVLSAGRHIQNSEGNGARLCCWQCLCVLAKSRRVVACEEVHTLFWKCVVQLNLRDVRHYIDMVGVQLLKESMISKTITRRNPSGLERSLYPLLTDVNQQTQCIPSLLVIAYYTVRDALAAHALKEYLRVVTPWMMSTDGLVRTISQSTCYEVMHRLTERGELDPVYRSFYDYLSSNQHIISMRKRQMSVIHAFDPAQASTLSSILASEQNNLHDFVPDAFLDRLAREMNVLFDLWHKNLGSQTVVKSDEMEYESVVDNFQKKILPWEESSKSEITSRKKQDIVLIASLVNKLWCLSQGMTCRPNLGGLTRTSEIFAVKTLVVSSLRVKKDPVFTSVGMRG